MPFPVLSREDKDTLPGGDRANLPVLSGIRCMAGEPANRMRVSSSDLLFVLKIHLEHRKDFWQRMIRDRQRHVLANNKEPGLWECQVRNFIQDPVESFKSKFDCSGSHFQSRT